VPTEPRAGCYVRSNQAGEDLYFAGRNFHDDAATYSSGNGSCTGTKTAENVVYAFGQSGAFAACVVLGEQGVSANDLSAFGNPRLTNLWSCLDA
jgi:hypothetical protein